MPHNAEKNGFGISGKIENVGEAVGDWRTNKKNYERNQGIRLDTRYLMSNYICLRSDIKIPLSCSRYSYHGELKSYKSIYIVLASFP